MRRKADAAPAWRGAVHAKHPGDDALLGELLRFRTFNRLKAVYRDSSVHGRKESAAEHSWSCLVLADHFLDEITPPLDRTRVFELLLYHDVVEIEAGDHPLSPLRNNVGQRATELAAAKRLAPQLPTKGAKRFLALFAEFEQGRTREARFAVAIDKLDAIIHELDHKEDWKGWSEKFLREKKERYFVDFPPLHETFEALIGYLKKERYFTK